METRKSKHRKTFTEVLHNCDNQVIVRLMIKQVMTDEQKQIVVDGFNADVDRRNKCIDEQSAL